MQPNYVKVLLKSLRHRESIDLCVRIFRPVPDELRCRVGGGQAVGGCRRPGRRQHGTVRGGLAGYVRKSSFLAASCRYPTFEPELRLMACVGPIDPATGHHRDNMLVFAEHGAF